MELIYGKENENKMQELIQAINRSSEMCKNASDPLTELYLKNNLTVATNLISRRQSIYISATISLVTHYHNISGKAFILTECYKRFSSNVLPEFLL